MSLEEFDVIMEDAGSLEKFDNVLISLTMFQMSMDEARSI